MLQKLKCKSEQNHLKVKVMLNNLTHRYLLLNNFLVTDPCMCHNLLYTV
jgi:hypothetical protein